VDGSPANHHQHFPSGDKAFSLVETIVAVFVLALAAVVCLAVVQNRNTARDKTTAIGDAPSAIDALQAELENESVTALETEIAAGDAIRVVYRKTVSDSPATAWLTLDSDKLTDSLGAEGPIYVAALSNSTLYDNRHAIEFDVSLGWIAPGMAAETAAELKARLGNSRKLCTYKVIVLAK
jgi:hypothetical protein